MYRVAVMHDWLITYAGAERVLEQLLLMYPQADLFCVCDFLPESERHFLGQHAVKTTFIQNLPAARRHYRNYLPFMPLAVEQFDLSGYDLIISCSHAVAKGILTGPDQLHISYVHSPIRYAWDLQHQYLHQTGLERGLKGWATKWLLHQMRLWDTRTANGVDEFIANSTFIARRIWKTYRRKAYVIYPPVDMDTFRLQTQQRDNYYLTASRLVQYKRIDLIIKAFSQMPENRLLVIGEGPEMENLKRLATGHTNIELLNYQSTAKLATYMRQAKAFVFAAEEDFGITPVEAQACGTPVIAYGKGGVLETVRGLETDRPTGVFFREQTPESLIGAVRRFEANSEAIRAPNCRRNAENFSAPRFRTEFSTLVEREREKFMNHDFEADHWNGLMPLHQLSSPRRADIAYLNSTRRK